MSAFAEWWKTQAGNAESRLWRNREDAKGIWNAALAAAEKACLEQKNQLSAQEASPWNWTHAVIDRCADAVTSLREPT